MSAFGDWRGPLLLAGALAVSCSGSPHGLVVRSQTTSGLDGAADRLDDLARGYFVTKQPEPDGYRSYLYLLLDSTDRESRQNRLVATAFLRMFDDTETIQEQTPGEPKKLAVALAPFDSRAAALKCLKRCDVDFFLGHYARARAREIWQAVSASQEMPRAAIVSLPVRASRMAQSPDIRRLRTAVWILPIPDEGREAIGALFRKVRERAIRNRFDTEPINARLARLVTVGKGCWLRDWRNGTCVGP